MKVLCTFLLLAAAAQSSAFVVAPRCGAMTKTSSSLQMGLFDFFSAEEKKKREDKKNREVEEQERFQNEIIERRRNPEKMEEYDAKVRLRRKLRAAGNDEAADAVKIYEA
jgi:hypothetical protein